MDYQNLWLDRRFAVGKTKPLLYLTREVMVMLALCVSVAFVQYIPLTIITFLLVIYYFIKSSLPRYKKAIKRQKQSPL